MESFNLELLQELPQSYGVAIAVAFGFATLAIFTMYGIYKAFGLISTINH